MSAAPRTHVGIWGEEYFYGLSPPKPLAPDLTQTWPLAAWGSVPQAHSLDRDGTGEEN